MDDNNAAVLSLESQLNLENFCRQVDQMSREQAQEMLKQTYRHMLMKETMYKYWIKANVFGK